MAITTFGRAKSLAATKVGTGGPTFPIANIQSYDFSRSKELAEFLLGTSRVVGHYAGTETAAITVEISDLAKHSLFEVGMKYTNVILTLESASDSEDVAEGDDVTITLSSAVVSEVGNPTKGNEDSAPVVASVTFTLSRHSGAASDPTWAIASAGA